MSAPYYLRSLLSDINAFPVTWNFDDGMESWANATAEEMRAVFWASGGELRGRIMQNTHVGDLPPHFDSPFFNIDMRDQETDKHHLVFRMKYKGKSVDQLAGNLCFVHRLRFCNRVWCFALFFPPGNAEMGKFYVRKGNGTKPGK